MRIVILGAGPGGLMAANRLKELCRDDCEVVVFDKEQNFSFGLSYLHVMVGKKKPNEVVRGREALKAKGIDFVKASVTLVDCENKLVKSSAGDYRFDYLIIAFGAELAPEKIKGLKESNYYTMYMLDSAMKLKEALNMFKGMKIAIVICSLPFKCPPAPYEAAMLIEDHLRDIGKRDIQIKVFTPEPFPMPVAGQSIGNRIIEMLNSRGIEFCGNHNLKEVRGDLNELVFENGFIEKYDMLIAIPPHSTPQVLRDCSLANENGWIPVNDKTMETKFENIFALGDCAQIILGIGKPLPKAASLAIRQAEVVASNIALQLLGTEAKSFDGVGECYLESGQNMASQGMGNFYAKPVPVVSLLGPSNEFYRLKEIWAEYWMRKLL
ncbi:MAG TPA: FAD/NAD(P)-binding oxidoreductase [archaeon]|nr:FAD/NAD(P)-binding oxidoreductase [archaeon]